MKIPFKYYIVFLKKYINFLSVLVNLLSLFVSSLQLHVVEKNISQLVGTFLKYVMNAHMNSTLVLDMPNFWLHFSYFNFILTYKKLYIKI